MSMYIILDFGNSLSFSHKTIFKLIFLNNEKTYGDGTIMVYTRLHVLLIDINKIEIGSDSNIGGKVTTSFVNISCLRKNIIKYSWYVFTSNKYYVMVYIKDRSEIGFLLQQQVPTIPNHIFGIMIIRHWWSRNIEIYTVTPYIFMICYVC